MDLNHLVTSITSPGSRDATLSPCHWFPAGGQRVGVVRFQTGDVATTESMLDTGVGHLPTLRQVTLLVHLRLRRVTSHIPLLNYAVEGANEELFVELVPKKKDMHVQCCGGLISKAFKFKLRMFRWQHICVSINLDTRIMHVIYDKLEYTVKLEMPGPEMSSRTRMEVVGGGRLVVGQKLYSMDGDFIVLETLDGEVGDWRLYDTALDLDQMKTLLSCREVTDLRPPMIDLSSGHFKVLGPTIRRNITLAEICSDRVTGFYLFFPQKMIFKHAYTWCIKLKGNLILPEDSESNAYFFDRFVRFKDQCDDIWTHLFWIGSGGNLTTRVWERLTDGEPIQWYRFLREYRTVTPEFQCIAVVTHDRYKWAACPCDIETCVLCNFTTHPEMRLRGLCKDSAFDRLFSFRDSDTYELVFDGLAHVMMEEQNDTWIMRSRLYPYLKAEMISQWVGQYPVGVHTWIIEGDRCRQKEVELLLTSCHDDEYTCNDGSCIRKDRRCDLSVDCADQSDEMDCSVVVVPDGYSAQLPPPTYKGTSLPIHFTLNITSVRTFDLVSFTIGIDVYIKMQWRDRRLKYNNLLSNMRANKLRRWREVWTPILEMEDGTKSAVEIKTHSQAAYAVRATGPLPDDDTTIREDITFSGLDNPLVFQEEATLVFKCYFELMMYPFDRQKCFIVFKMKDVTEELGMLVKEGQGVNFVGSRRLLEYTLYSEAYKNYTKNEISHVEIEFQFRNQYSYYISNTFLPSLIQVIISLVTLRFDLADFQDRIMVSLTSLLVLATFFTQTSQSIPKTSYLKLIDVWFVGLIFGDFCMILSLVYVETLRLKETQGRGIKVTPFIAISDKKSASYMESRAARINRMFIKLFSVSILLMLMCFVPTCMYAILEP
uniref:C-type lectin domain-containing protein n=1 Tax=Scylla olivacea TaxID=85551 RepID=A0A0N7Z9T0_SCYOL